MNNILKYLSDLSGDNTYYLTSLNLIKDVNLDYYRTLSSHFSDADLDKLLSQDNWRLNLVAYTYFLSVEAKEKYCLFQKALERESFISPQLVVAIALFAKQETEAYFKELLVNSDISSKTKGAIFAVLPWCSYSKLCLNTLEIEDLSQFNIGYLTSDTHIRFWKLNR